MGPNFKRPPPPAATAIAARPHRVKPQRLKPPAARPSDSSRGRTSRASGGLCFSRRSSTVWSSRHSRPIRIVGATQASLRRRTGTSSFGATDQLLSGHPGELQRRSREERRRFHRQSDQSPANQPLLHSLHSPADVELCPRCVWRHSPPGRNRPGPSRQQSLPTRGRLFDLEQQCGGDCGAEIPRCADKSPRPCVCSSCNTS